ncbi:S-layer homology domain-containing protein [Paramaledivibacter caminithermalis]|jgi:hypothetical protein|uniref:S-layer homology domain-containing protein n=1 Tax=Paramaledivibacter caminithermalis (strain DSM 15212 / CIP 107654 / DViRD3) TaxID=1121301 RepID=A0A1M6LRE3_PARC5|nr:S-layer homology domain-containing protein [Paramaledivibacter caminithermalis]SHJ73808.1 S-layer homology domain-containing protein [Paramaledivibacter caminithermalis DSM 15212]
MKRILSLTLVLTLVATSGFSVAFADPWKKDGGKKLPPGLAKKVFFPSGNAKRFRDIDDCDWAEDAIEKMVEKGVVKGIGDGLFAPRNAVTKLEAVVMALRVMGEEDIAVDYKEKIQKGKKKLKLKDRLQEWAYGYVALAEEKGILDEADILYFRLNEPAKRHEVAKYIIRVLGYEDEAQDHMDSDLDFRDAAFIPQGSVGYIYIADKEGIITGYEDETFRPLNTVTRAEMAVMIARLDDKIDEDVDQDEFEIYRGEVEDIDDDYEWIEISIGSKDKRFEINDETEVVFEDDLEGNIDDIEKGDEVKVRINEDDEAEYIKVDRELDYDIYEGLLIEVDDEEISILSSKEIISFEVDSDIKVEFKDEEGKLEDLMVGDEVELKINEDDEVERIEVDRNYDAIGITGKLIDIYEDENQISIKEEDKVRIYDFKASLEVYVNDEEAELWDLEKDDNVLLILDDGKVSEIRVYKIVLVN